MIELSDLQRDALGELFNIGVGRAASSLSQIVNDEVLLSAPVVALVQPHTVSESLLGSDFREVSMVTLDFAGPFDARTMLIFPERNALAIVSKMISVDMTPEELAEFEQEALCEVGNIILNACISALADLFEVEFHGGLPTHHYSDSNNLQSFSRKDQNVVLILQINLTISQERIDGHLLFLLSVSSLASLLECIDRFLAKQGMA
jgi:chemotaxis protein CheC